MTDTNTNTDDAAQTLRTNLKTLGIKNVYPPGDLPEETDEWHYTEHHDERAIIDSTGSTLSRQKTYGKKTRFKYQHSTDTSSWHCGTLNISFNHEPSNPDDVEHDEHDVEPENAVYGVYIYLPMNWIKPVENRESKHDRRRHDREELLAVDSDTPVDTEYVLETVRVAQQRLTERAETLDE